MFRDRVIRVQDRVRHALRTAWEEEHTPHEVATSFAIGIFVTALPTGGLGIGSFFLFAYWWSWISKPAIFSSVAVLNPAIKPAVYLGSFYVGATLFGTDPLIATRWTHLETALLLIQLLLIGNLILAVVLAGVAYVAAYYLVRNYVERADQQTASPASDLPTPFWRK